MENPAIVLGSIISETFYDIWGHVGYMCLRSSTLKSQRATCTYSNLFCIK